MLKIWPSVMLAAGIGLTALGNHLRPPPRPMQESLSVMIPVPVQIVAAFGDRYLAANIGTWRAIMVGTHRMSKDELTALSQVQDSASWLNPGHEDNYYTAAAILPWAGELEATQRILKRATQARPHDLYPSFFHGFNALYFLGDGLTASQSLRTAAAHAQSNDERQALSVLAARWSERNNAPQIAIGIVSHMAKESKDPALKAYLAQRVVRLEGLVQLRAAATRYQERYGRPLENLEQLVSGGILAAVPVDPLGDGYGLQDNQPVLLSPKN